MSSSSTLHRLVLLAYYDPNQNHEKISLWNKRKPSAAKNYAKLELFPDSSRMFRLFGPYMKLNEEMPFNNISYISTTRSNICTEFNDRVAKVEDDILVIGWEEKLEEQAQLQQPKTAQGGDLWNKMISTAIIDGNILKKELRFKVYRSWTTTESLAMFHNQVAKFIMSKEETSSQQVPQLYKCLPMEFTSGRFRDATVSMAGYLHQLDIAPQYWVDLALDDTSGYDYCILVEFVEDVAKVPLSMVTQVTQYQVNGCISPIQFTSHDSLVQQKRQQLIFDQVKLKDTKSPHKFFQFADCFFSLYQILNKVEQYGMEVDVELRITTSSQVADSDKWNDSTNHVDYPFFKRMNLNDEKVVETPKHALDSKEWSEFLKVNKTQLFRDKVTVRSDVSNSIVVEQICKSLSSITGITDGNVLMNLYKVLYMYMKNRIIADRYAKRLECKMFTRMMLEEQIAIFKQMPPDEVAKQMDDPSLSEVSCDQLVSSIAQKLGEMSLKDRKMHIDKLLSLLCQSNQTETPGQ